jgi:hypothetical protein
MMRWWWFGPSATTTELEREMRLMKGAGIGGFEIQPVYPLLLDDPQTGFRNYQYLSDEFIDALRFSSSKAQEFGLRLDLTLGSGWPYGGPSVRVTEAAARLRFEIISVAAGARSVPLPYISTGEKLLATFLASGDRQHFSAAGTRELTDIHHGVVTLPAQITGPHVLLVFISSRTGMMVKRAAAGAEGFVLDHYNPAAVQHYLHTTGERLMQGFGSHPPRAIFCDSLEVEGSDWTDDLLEQFRIRRGYDLKPRLPALVFDSGTESAAIRHDWGETLSELFNERFAAPLQQWAHQHGTLLRAQFYGTPPAELSSYGRVDLPEGEGARWNAFVPTRWASSAGHLYGRQVISSETWTWLHSPAFRASPLDLKAEADRHFLEGINQLVGHGWPYSPPEAGYPGWRFYAAAALNQNNPWWLVMPDVAAYLQRISFMLRQGEPATDVAIYLPTDDAWAHFSPGHVSLSESMDNLLGSDLIATVLSVGYNFDFIDDPALGGPARVASGGLEVNGHNYRLMILPGIERIPPSTYHKIEQFVREGGALIATRRQPSLAPEFLNQQQQTEEVRAISRELFATATGRAGFVADERARLASELRHVLPPDVTESPSIPEIGFIHRRLPDADIYFLANTSNVAQSTQATFHTGFTRAEW